VLKERRRRVNFVLTADVTFQLNCNDSEKKIILVFLHGSITSHFFFVLVVGITRIDPVGKIIVVVFFILVGIKLSAELFLFAL